MRRDRGWALPIGVILLVNAAVILSGAGGRIEGIVGGVICAIGGTVNVVFSCPYPRSRPEHDDRDSQNRDTA